MTRVYVTTAEPFRDLVRLANDVQRGADVKALESAGGRRLEARGVERSFGRDGVLTADEFDGLVTAARLLGALESTLDKRDAHGRPVLTVGAQQMIRYPGRRTDAQMARAEQRMDALVKERADRPSTPGKLSPEQVREARQRAVAAFALAYRHAPSVHYTQSAARFGGIRNRLRSADGHYPTQEDCSSMFTWCTWNGVTGVGGMDFPDVVNGAGWVAGYTGTMLTHGRAVSMDNLELGDAILYGHGWPGSHVAMYKGGGRVYSHGSEAGPFDLPARYRSDIIGARRYIE